MVDASREGSLAVTPPPERGTAVGDGARTAPSPARRRGQADWRKRLEIGVLAGPAILMFVTFVLFPVLLAAYYGFFRWKGFGPPTDFAGLDNYLTIFRDSTFIDALQHNAVIVVLSLVLQGPAAVLLALLLNQKMRGRSLVRVLIFVPYVVSEVIVGTGWGLMLQTNGAVNDLLVKAGFPEWTVDWLSDPKVAIWSLMLIITWKYIGFAVILFLAGLQSIPEELFEAAAIDGATYWQTQRRITLPLLGPTIRIWAFLSMIGALQLFDLVYIIWGQYVASTAGTSTMATYMVANGRNAGNYGFGNAVAVVLFLISLVLALTYQRFVLRRDTEGALTEGKK
ncbi:carbohydrate ABC transporter permease [Cellulomonas marina]|uniref:Multiple sugar transport system permease protein/raffinose/stachyose/melibiose transport system permease protein n=1 Tax=Cellulomonas marina TaxID=988821 RepID=A0A1I0YLX3_9CELL|nr:sugar ABC transporter permease [Cellulomonas marina]GIG27638.1 sugar ABC transporter permease [Cellulomonas marina]SFB14399.1 multiple sugar transport system permease protein/raffinose/stachyose/melibiose transport system permease protein [Cellulomonas marina]